MANKHYLIFGAGAIGTTVATWLNQAQLNVCLFDTQAVAEHINQHGLDIYHGEKPNVRHKSQVHAYWQLADVPKPDVIILCVKNYSLHGVSQLLSEHFGKETMIVGLQNGIENQQVLPEYFSKIIYGVLCFNAWVDGFGVVGYQKKGPIALGHNGGIKTEEINAITRDFNKGVESIVYQNLADTAHCKIVINLTNSLTTLVALHQNDQSKSKKFQKLLTSMTYEGIKVMKAAGFKESQLGGMPSWALITAAGLLPGFLTRKPYLKNLKKLVVSSMAQDIILKGGSVSELESINGYVIDLAKKHNVNIPVNNAIYALCKEAFSQQPFKAISIDAIWARVKS
ncbi:ketopantoate reductase family protein [Shewanella surugensis]|uniref:2-dehydropantoate 2-reductase n=1 Tax=Shewanella surugensis TaxID=212020 RepID=A0ABT0L5Q1_9GAMM|nr:2-dehydropantoate 2-reductase [Shewanella surugensis]MCL1123018.1 2-dehydropantoate 2-reductase [Shewanella surugensis]